MNIRSLLTNEVELELNSRGVANLNNPLSILKACKRFVAMDEKDREEGLIDRLEALNSRLQHGISLERRASESLYTLLIAV